MSLAEKLYLAMILFLFGSFMVLMMTMAWLDAKDDRIRRRRARAAAVQKDAPHPHGAAAHR
jgi:hypothetical protein